MVLMKVIVAILMMGVQGRVSTTDGISAAVHHSPLIHESGRRDEAKIEAPKHKSVLVSCLQMLNFQRGSSHLRALWVEVFFQNFT
jgi:hypothetical protein